MKAYEEKIKVLFTNEEFTKKMETLEDVEKIGELFKAYDVELTNEELAEILQAAVGEKQETELDESDMENVAGGGIVGASAWLLKKTWGFACDYWGGPKEAVNATVSFWVGVFK